MKPILVLDFDGVCHSYTSGWQGPGIISDPPVDGLFEFLREAGKAFTIHILSSRSAYPEGIKAMRSWFEEWGKDEDLPPLNFPDSKVAAHVTIDDRAVTFSGRWPDVEILIKFKPWNR